MKYLFIVFLLSLSVGTGAKELCDMVSIGLDEQSSEIEKLFYTGTCHYRNEEYGLSVQSWKKITSIEPISAEDEMLKVDVLNNLGYMKFYGYGTKENQEVAMSYWRKAILLGHYEAEYHLCRAYADENQSTYHVAKARKHCEKARLIYKGKNDEDSDILSDIEFYLDKLGG